MIPITWIVTGVGALSLVTGAYFYGDSNGANRVIARNAKAEAKAIAAMEKGRRAIDTVSGQLAEARHDQDTETRTIYHEATRIIERQSIAVCISSDGVQLLDKARANANRTLARLPYDIPAGASEGASQ